MIVKSGYSRDNREYNFKEFTLKDNIPSHCQALDIYGKVVNVHITSIKTWKRNPNKEIHWKYGLYEYGYSLLTPEGFSHGVVLGSAELIEEG